MPLIADKDREQVQKIFAENLAAPVKLVMFTQEFECDFCAETRQLVEELSATSDLLQAEVYDFLADKTVAESYGVDKIPAIAVVGEKDYGVRFYGIPSGYEFSTLIEDIISVSRGESGLSEATVAAVAGIHTPVHLQVFVTPTCPYCPNAVSLAHRLAIESEYIRADMVEAVEFPHLANKYQVFGVPRTVINETTHVEGMVPEATLVEALLQAVSGE